MTLEYKIPRYLWENFEAVLKANTKRLIAEYAKILEVPEKELQQKVLASYQDVPVTIIDTNSESGQCHAYLQCHEMTIFCRKPVAYHSQFCTFHRDKRMLVVQETTPTVIEKVKDGNKWNRMWVIHNNTLINSKGHIVGKINKEERKVKLFVL
jgi:hypothetical protein